MDLISVSESNDYLERSINYIQSIWAGESSKMVYEDCIKHSLNLSNSLPRWYLLVDGDVNVGCAGLITNDFISRMDLYPWVCALYVEKGYRGQGYGELLLNKAKIDARNGGFKNLYLCTDHIGYYQLPIT